MKTDIMHILHICNDFLGTNAHESLYRELDRLGIRQTVFVPIKKNIKKKKKLIDFNTMGSSIIYSEGLGFLYKFLFGLKIRKLVKNIENTVDLSSVDIIHTPILCNEGAIAYELFKVYNIPYISAVRNSDINDYIKFFRWRLFYFRNIALKSERLVFISSKYPNKLKRELFLSDKKIGHKTRIIHNGINEFYLENRNFHETKLKDPIRILITGAFVKNKNIHNVYDAVKILRSKGYNIEMTAIGNNLSTNPIDREYSKKLLSLSLQNDWFRVYDAEPKEKLIMSFRNNDIFVLVSYHETFGLSYVEALSQGLPIVYTCGEGFDGVYPDGLVGYGAYANSPLSISNAINKVISNYVGLTANIKTIDLSEYCWRKIALVYKELYNDILIKD